MGRPFDQIRSQLERQYLDVRFDSASGLSKEALVSEFERHRADNPEESRILTRAWLLRLLCEKGRIAPEPGLPFVGKLEHHDLLLTLRNSWRQEAGAREFASDPPIPPGSWSAQLDCASHICPDWSALLKHGPRGLRDAAAARTSDFHQAVAMVFDGMVTLIKRFSVLRPDPVLAALADRPPATLHEALQLACIYHELLELDGMQVRSMGRFDLLYNDHYLCDLEAGRLTRDQAANLLKCFMISFFAKTQGKLFGKPFLCGPDANELSYLIFEAYHEMRIEDPKFHVRLSDRTPTRFLEKVVRCIQDGCTSIVLVNNDGQVDMLTRNGKAREDAEDYVLIGCYEPAVQGKELNCSGRRY